MGEENRILKVLDRLEELKRRGLIDEENYREKRDLLLSKYLELGENQKLLKSVLNLKEKTN